MCPPYFRAHTQVGPYENIENFTWDMTPGPKHHQVIVGHNMILPKSCRPRLALPFLAFLYRESPGVGAGLKPAPTAAFIVGGGPNRVMVV